MILFLAVLAAHRPQPRQRLKHQLLAVTARYDRRSGRVMIALNNGAVVGFPLASFPGLECATPDEVSHIVVEGGGYGLHVASLDADISVPQLLSDQLGSTVMKRAVIRANASRKMKMLCASSSSSRSIETYFAPIFAR